MLSGTHILLRAPLIAITFVMTAHQLLADDAATSANGDKIVPVNVDGKTLPIKVEEAHDPFQNVSSAHAISDGKYDPERIFSSTSSFSNKSYLAPSSSVSENSSDYNNRDRNTFITKAYMDDGSSPTAPNLHEKATIPTAAAYDQSADGFDKSYVTSNADMAHPAVFASSTDSADQNHTAVLGGPEKPEGLGYDNTFDKQYLGPGAQHVPADLAIKDNVVISRMSGLPNRPLSIDEVRNLINHGFEPDTSAKPAEPSKPLNDPNYKPEPLRDMPATSSDDDKNEPVPPPGTMAAPPAPENSEPLPQP